MESFEKRTWDNMRLYYGLSCEPRSGFYECHLYPKPTEETTKLRFESVGEHSGSMANLVMDVLMEYPHIIKERSIVTVVKVAQIHDIAEVFLHDISDCGSEAHEAKKELERMIFWEYSQRLSMRCRQSVFTTFLDMDSCKTHDGMFLKCADKFEAVYKLLFYETKNLYGNVYMREPTTDRDKDFAKIVGTGNCTDVWAYHAYDLTRDFPKDVKEPFVAILHEAMQDVRGHFFSWWE